jgi:CBS domain-containing protein
MARQVKDIMLALSEYAVVDEDATILDALHALDASQARLPAGRQPHRAILVRDARGQIVGKLHHFAFLRALRPERRTVADRGMLDRAGVGDDLRDRSMRTLDLLAGDLVDVCARARSVAVRDVYTSATVSIDEGASLFDAMAEFLAHQTLSLLVRRGGQTVGILRLSDLFDELARQIKAGECLEDKDGR